MKRIYTLIIALFIVFVPQISFADYDKDPFCEIDGTCEEEKSVFDKLTSEIINILSLIIFACITMTIIYSCNNLLTIFLFAFGILQLIRFI
jgi:hypothetical protein